MTIPDSVSEVTFFFGCHADNDFDRYQLDRELGFWWSSVDDTLTVWEAGMQGYAYLYIISHPPKDIDLFKLESGLKDVLLESGLSL